LNPYKILAQFLQSLKSDPPPPPITYPAWIFEEAQVVNELTVRDQVCYVFELVNPEDGVTGYVLNVSGGEVVPIYNEDVQSAVDHSGRW